MLQPERVTMKMDSKTRDRFDSTKDIPAGHD